MLKALRTGKLFQHLSEGHVIKNCNFHPCPRALLTGYYGHEVLKKVLS